MVFLTKLEYPDFPELPECATLVAENPITAFVHHNALDEIDPIDSHFHVQVTSANVERDTSHVVTL